MGSRTSTYPMALPGPRRSQLIQARLGLRRQGKAGDICPQPLQPEAKPPAFEARVPCYENAPASPERRHDKLRNRKL